jgi:hypothetical protein
MKKTCLLYTAVFLAFAICLTAVLAALWPSRPGATPPRPPLALRLGEASLGGLLAATFLTLAFASVETIGMKTADRARVARSLAGGRPEDGCKIAAVGTLVADGPALTAPFSGAPCVAYHYAIKYTSTGKGSTTITSCWGYALTPSHLETAAGVVRLLAYTDFEFRPTTMKGPEMLERARRHFATSRFVTIGLGAIGSAWKALGTVLADDDGAIRTDFGPPPEDLENPRLTFEEQAVADREPVCAFGTYSAGRGGLVPVQGTRDVYPVRVVKGTGPEVLRKLFWSVVGQCVLAVAFAGVAAGVVYGFLRFARTGW